MASRPLGLSTSHRSWGCSNRPLRWPGPRRWFGRAGRRTGLRTGLRPVQGLEQLVSIDESPETARTPWGQARLRSGWGPPSWPGDLARLVWLAMAVRAGGCRCDPTAQRPAGRTPGEHPQRHPWPWIQRAHQQHRQQWRQQREEQEALQQLLQHGQEGMERRVRWGQGWIGPLQRRRSPRS